jgi:hypothetical protein
MPAQIIFFRSRSCSGSDVRTISVMNFLRNSIVLGVAAFREIASPTNSKLNVKLFRIFRKIRGSMYKPLIAQEIFMARYPYQRPRRTDIILFLLHLCANPLPPIF